MTKRRFPSAESREKTRQVMAEAQRHAAEQVAQHLAKYGPHTCTPDPTDPWSACSLDTQHGDIA